MKPPLTLHSTSLPHHASQLACALQWPHTNDDNQTFALSACHTHAHIIACGQHCGGTWQSHITPLRAVKAGVAEWRTATHA